MLAVDEALGRITAAFQPQPSEWVHLAAAHGRVLAEDLVAARDQPPQAVSAMDGYAVRAADLAGGSAELHLVGEAPAGGRFEGTLGPGETVRIFTGGALPAGGDAVALQENAIVQADRVRLEGRVEAGTFVRPAGLDFRGGELALPAGRRLSARDLGLAAALNRAWLPVRRRPRIALLATGDELVMPGQALAATQIVNSNTVALAAMVETWGGLPSDLGVAPDDPTALAACTDQMVGMDLVVTLGGASVGERDLVRSVLGERGLELDFWQVAMRPGKPLMFGAIQGVRLLGLPGNPVSAGVCAVLFVRAVIATLLGVDPAPPEVPAVLGRALGPNDRRQEYLRASAAWGPDGRLVATPAERQDSSMLATFARADCLIVRAPFAPAMAEGTPVTVLPLRQGPIGV
ncbi:MAG: moeA 1 [Geminicoccaceae bacterium]|jgi:molybdopterin molybdotransferase|nr:moeA 1 [Geminicoccaceae bacterium]